MAKIMTFRGFRFGAYGVPKIHHHYYSSDERIDVQLWIVNGGKPIDFCL